MDNSTLSSEQFRLFEQALSDHLHRVGATYLKNGIEVNPKILPSVFVLNDSIGKKISRAKILLDLFFPILFKIYKNKEYEIGFPESWMCDSLTMIDNPFSDDFYYGLDCYIYDDVLKVLELNCNAVVSTGYHDARQEGVEFLKTQFPILENLKNGKFSKIHEEFWNLLFKKYKKLILVVSKSSNHRREELLQRHFFSKVIDCEILELDPDKDLNRRAFDRFLDENVILKRSVSGSQIVRNRYLYDAFLNFESHGGNVINSISGLILGSKVTNFIVRSFSFSNYVGKMTSDQFDMLSSLFPPCFLLSKEGVHLESGKCISVKAFLDNFNKNNYVLKDCFGGGKITNVIFGKKENNKNWGEYVIKGHADECRSWMLQEYLCPPESKNYEFDSFCGKHEIRNFRELTRVYSSVNSSKYWALKCLSSRAKISLADYVLPTCYV